MASPRSYPGEPLNGLTEVSIAECSGNWSGFCGLLTDPRTLSARSPQRLPSPLTGRLGHPDAPTHRDPCSFPTSHPALFFLYDPGAFRCPFEQECARSWRDREGTVFPAPIPASQLGRTQEGPVPWPSAYSTIRSGPPCASIPRWPDVGGRGGNGCSLHRDDNMPIGPALRPDCQDVIEAK
jgi:hypothetical protein